METNFFKEMKFVDDHNLALSTSINSITIKLTKKLKIETIIINGKN